MNEIYIKHLDWSGICILDENNIIYRKDFPTEKGLYDLFENRLIIYWEKWEKDIFYYRDSIYYLQNLLQINNNLTIIYPNKLVIDNTLVFSNITLSGKKIILTSNYYLDAPLNLNDLKINLFTLLRKSISYTQNIYQNSSNIETILSIILDLDEYYDEIIITVFDKLFFLTQINTPATLLSAMTLFKDDYPLLKQYIKYYHSLGINLFFLYYNSKITHQFLSEIKRIILIFPRTNIYLIEWDYPYFIPSNNSIFNKQHHSQTMAINDSLHILKKSVKYTLYNDLDEYILLESYQSFKELVNQNLEIDIFVFKNQFCKMGEEIVSYNNFYDIFDISKIIYGNYWNEKREKNLIKLKNVNCMGVHSTYTNDLNIQQNTMYISKFCHFINFKEKNREELMTEFVVHL
jgi:hypothetical protein